MNYFNNPIKIRACSFFSVLVVLALFAYSCKDNPVKPKLSDSFDLTSQITVENGDVKFTETFINWGVRKVSIVQAENATILHFNAPNNFMDRELQKKSGLNFYIQNEVLYMKGVEQYGVTLINDSPFMITPTFKGYLKEFDESKFNKEIAILLLTLKEITADDRIEQNEIKPCNIALMSDCPFSDRATDFQFGFSRSVAKDGMGGQTNDVKQFEKETGTTCTEIGDVDTTCVRGDHLCVSTQTYCCQ